MTKFRIQSHKALKAEMKAVARGSRPASADASVPSFNSAQALLRLLTPENRSLLAVLRDKKPQSIAELSQMTGRAQPNVTRTLMKLEAIGLIRMRQEGRRKVPVATVRRVRFEIDPYAVNDRLELA
ncbi:MAG: MarR family transcriptional regulator [Alphaproteobacteria bacterium]